MKITGHSTEIETDLLRLFRLFIGLRMMMIVVITVREVQSGQDPLIPAMLVSAGVSLYLLVHLSMPGFQKTFGRLYLPTALILTTLGILVEQRMLQMELGLVEISTNHPEAGETILIYPPIITVATTAFLFVPLVLTSWQYSFKVVMAYTLITTQVDMFSLALVVHKLPVSFAEEFIAIHSRAASFLIVGYIVSRLVTTKKKQNAALAAANRQLKQHAATLEQLTISRERNRMAREIHDTLAHTISAVTVKLSAVSLIWESDPAKGQRMLNEVIASMDEGMVETRRALRDLRASPLEDMGLLLALEQIADTAAKRSGCKLTVNLPENLPELPFTVEQGIYRIAQEALENIVKHANAQAFEVVLTIDTSHIRLTVHDDGQGFDTQQGFTEHFGVQGMTERADMLGGTLDIHSTEEQGTTVRLVLER